MNAKGEEAFLLAFCYPLPTQTTLSDASVRYKSQQIISLQ